MTKNIVEPWFLLFLDLATESFSSSILAIAEQRAEGSDLHLTSAIAE